MGFFNRAAATANRLMRTQQVDMAMSSLRDQQRKLAAEIGMKTLELYRAGNVIDPALTPLFQQFQALEQQIAERESEKKAIEAEAMTPPAQPQPAPAAPQAHGHLCSKDRTPIPAGSAFCPRCGAPAIDVAPPEPPRPQAASASCAKCGATVPAGSAFCPECGAAQSRPAS